MFRLSSPKPLACIALVISLLTITMVGGCPVAQTPSTPPDDTQNQDQGTNTDTDTGGLDRPIPAPPADDTGTGTGTDTGGTGEVPSDGGTTPGGGTGTTASAVIVNPSADSTLRVGTNLPIIYRVSDTQASLRAVELVLARDDDNNAQADGDVVYAKSVAFVLGNNSSELITSEAALANLVQNGASRFLLGTRIRTAGGETRTSYSPIRIVLDNFAPGLTWTPKNDQLLSSSATVNIQLTTNDTSKTTLRVVLDDDLNPLSGNEVELLSGQSLNAGTNNINIDLPLSGVPTGTRYIYAVLSDGAAPSTAAFAPLPQPKDGQTFARLAITNRLVGDFDLNKLVDNSQGAILQGFNFNDLAGSSITQVPDLNGDGIGEFMIGSRFGKPYGVGNAKNVGYGEAYLLYGSTTRLRGEIPLNSVPAGTYRGLTFPGIRANKQTVYTQGLADVTYVPDMDGDELPELIFSFPRVESVSLSETSSLVNPVQPDLGGMGSFEYDAFNNSQNAWQNNAAQFTRGGIVIVSSANAVLVDQTARNRKGQRIVDLHEIGQMFQNMGTPDMAGPFVLAGQVATSLEDCDEEPGDETEFSNVTLYWDVVFRTQGPGGFFNRWTYVPYDTAAGTPPLCNDKLFPFSNASLDSRLNPANYTACESNCMLTNAWFDHTFGGMALFPGGGAAAASAQSWREPGGQYSIWSGFCGGNTPHTEPLRGTIGARILGQKVDDDFGSSVAADGQWLYISAPRRTALKLGDNVGSLPADRAQSGVVYMLQTDARPFDTSVNSAQLWLEPVPASFYEDLYARELGIDFGAEGAPGVGNFPMGWPVKDLQWIEFIDFIPSDRQFWNLGRPAYDFSMPLPHQYVIEEVGSLREDYSDYGDLDQDGLFALYQYTTDAGGVGGVGASEWQSIHSGVPGTPGGPAPFESSCDFDLESLAVYGGNQAAGAYGYLPRGQGQAAYYVDDVKQIVGPHSNARVGTVRTVGDVNDDGFQDFAIGSADVTENFGGVYPGGSTTPVGAIFVVYGRALGLEGDLLLENLARDPSDLQRREGFVVRGSSVTGDRLARVFDGAGDFNGDGITDVVVGNDQSSQAGQPGEAIVILGAPQQQLMSPAGGYTPDSVVQAGRAIRFLGASAGDLTGANVAGIGDIDRDGYADILVSAPAAEGGRGVTYLIYGRNFATGEYSLAQIGTVDLPGTRFIGRAAGDRLGGGTQTITNSDPNNRTLTVNSRGVASIGDINNDGRPDFAISSMLASPGGKLAGGEVYVIYGR